MRRLGAASFICGHVGSSTWNKVNFHGFAHGGKYVQNIPVAERVRFSSSSILPVVVPLG